MTSIPGPFGTYAAVHQNPSGPGDSRPTTTQILKDEGLLTFPNRLAAKTVLITGGTSGLGIELARALYSAGAKVTITGRGDPAKGYEVADSISSLPLSDQNGDGSHGNKEILTYPVQFLHMDLADLSSVQDGARKFLAQSDNKLNLLICCAGVMMPPERMTTAQGHELQFGVNHLAHFTLFKHVSRALINSSSEEFASRVVMVASSAHRGSSIVDDGDYDFEKRDDYQSKGYGQSKTANIFVSNEIEQRFGTHGLHSVSVHPGVIMETGLLRHLTDDGGKMAKQMEKDVPGFAGRPKKSQQGAGCILWAAVASKLEGIGGVFLEDCDVSQPVKEGLDERTAWAEPGRASWCYDKVAAKKLWLDSEEIVSAYV